MTTPNPPAGGSNPPTTADTTPVTMLSNGRLSGKVAIVTAGAVGFGAAIAKKFTAEGAKVVVVDINADLAKDVAKSYPDGKVVPVAGDVSLIDTWHKALKVALDNFEHLDIVVNNAGVVMKATPSHEADEAEFDRLIRINVKPPVPQLQGHCALSQGSWPRWKLHQPVQYVGAETEAEDCLVGN